MLLIVHPMKEGTYTKSSGYGPRWGTHHNGVDFAAPIGTPIYAAANGVVVEGKDRTGVNGFGSWIWINCRDSAGVDLIYGHVQHSGILVRKGDRVVAGQQIGVVGNEGESTGPHLHFEVWRSPGRVGGVHIDPEPWLSGAASPGSSGEKMSTVIDFSASTPSARSIKDAGYSGAVRYISPPRYSWMQGKPVTLAQVEDMRSHGLDIACVWQFGGAARPDAMRGRAGGLEDARAAEAHLKAVGLDGWPVFFAVDFDITLSQWNQTAVKYFEAACEVLGRDRVGIYGHSRALDWAREDGVVADLGGGKFLGWQTVSWSRGVIHNGAVLLQNVHNVPGPEGVQIDINDVRHTYWGQSPRNTDKGESVTVQDNAVDIDLHQLIKFGRPTSLPKKRIIVHTTENNPGTPSRNIVDYQVRTRSGSYHRLVDATGQITMANTDGWQVWATGNKGNDIALHVSCVTWAKSTREDWLNQPKMLEGVARTIAYWARTYDIPLVKLSREELGAGKHGVAGHLEAQVWGNTTHWDPGYNFPYDVVLARAKEINAGGGAKPEPVSEPEPEVEPSIPSDHVVSLVNPRVHFPEKFALALIDRATWENHKMLKKLLEINKVDPDEFLAEEVRKDNEGV